jgi:hypothetical protein
VNWDSLSHEEAEEVLMQMEYEYVPEKSSHGIRCYYKRGGIFFINTNKPLSDAIKRKLEKMLMDYIG